MKILGVEIDNVTKTEALGRVENFLESKTQHKIFTPNPEMLVDARRDHYFKKALNSGELNIPDGFGLSLVSFGKVKRMAGGDFMKDICKLAEQKKYSVYFLGSGSKEVVENLKNNIQKQFPDLKIKGVHTGHEVKTLKVDEKIQLVLDKEKNNDLIADIVMHAPDIVFVAFGHGKQEKWVYEYLRDLPSVKIAMGVGGAFDFLSGNKKRAPKWMRKMGLEWFYRLVNEPSRFRRIWKATVIFLYYSIFKKAH